MGLFIGASILTILELFDYIYEVRFGVTLGEMTKWWNAQTENQAWLSNNFIPPTQTRFSRA